MSDSGPLLAECVLHVPVLNVCLCFVKILSNSAVGSVGLLPQILELCWISLARYQVFVFGCFVLLFFYFSIHTLGFMWPPCIADTVIMFFPCGFFLFLFISFLA